MFNIVRSSSITGKLLLAVIYMLVVSVSVPATVSLASDTPNPSSVTIAGSFQDELGCPGDWQPDCATTHLTFDAEDGVWQEVFTIPAGNWEYKAALNDSWDENYGLGAQSNGPNIQLNLSQETSVKFYYAHETHWITDDVNSIIVTAPGSYQSEMGNSGDWDPEYLGSWLQDPDGDGIYTFTTCLPAGSYETKVAVGESWDENYGEGGVPNGPNIPFTVSTDCTEMLFSFDYGTKVMTIAIAPPEAQPAAVTIAGSFQDELGCPGDWQPDCATTHLTFDAEDGVWQGVFTIPAGKWEYKAALNDSWDENYGLNAQRNGSNIQLSLAQETSVKFYYDHETHWVTDDVNSIIVTAPGSYQNEIGCGDDWQPWCLRSWLQDPDGDGIYTFSTCLPAGNYETKVAIGESWDENYGEGGVPNGPNIPFIVPSTCTEMLFSYDSETHILSVSRLFSNENQPFAKLSSPYSADEGTTVQFDASNSTDPDGDELHYRWDLDNDGNWDTEWSSNSTVSHTWYDDWSGEVKVEVSDGTLSDYDTAVVMINNVAPVLDPYPDQKVTSGNLLDLLIPFTDPGTLDTHTADISWGDNLTEAATVSEVDGSGNITGSHLYTKPGIYTISVSVADDNGGKAAINFNVEVQKLIISIDVKPGSDKNPVNPGSKGRTPIAILTTDTFDTTTANLSTITCGPGQAIPVHYAFGDVDYDGDNDTILHFNTQELGLTENTTVLTISGQTFDGVYFEGADLIQIVPDKDKRDEENNGNHKENAPGQNREKNYQSDGRETAPGHNKEPKSSAEGKGKETAPGQIKKSDK